MFPSLHRCEYVYGSVMLTFNSSCSYAYTPCLQGERILKVAEMCRKLETETEKVLPFYASSLTPEEDEDVAAAMQEAPSESLAEVLYIALWSLHD